VRLYYGVAAGYNGPRPLHDHWRMSDSAQPSSRLLIRHGRQLTSLDVSQRQAILIALLLQLLLML